MPRGLLVMVTKSVVATLTTSCDAEISDGPRKQICGDWISRAEDIIGSGPWYVDASDGSTPNIVAAVATSPTWVQVGNDCALGARVSVSDPSVVAVTSSILAQDGGDVAVLVSPRTVGHATLVATMPGAIREAVSFTVDPPPSRPSS
jgi:hypothetical protein